MTCRLWKGGFKTRAFVARGITRGSIWFSSFRPGYVVRDFSITRSPTFQVARLGDSRESGYQRQKNRPSRFAPWLVETSRRGEFETGPTRANPGKYWVETQTGRRFKASACWYNRRVKLSSISLIQLRDTPARRKPIETSHLTPSSMPKVGSDSAKPILDVSDCVSSRRSQNKVKWEGRFTRETKDDSKRSACGDRGLT